MFPNLAWCSQRGTKRKVGEGEGGIEQFVLPTGLGLGRGAGRPLLRGKGDFLLGEGPFYMGFSVGASTSEPVGPFQGLIRFSPVERESIVRSRIRLPDVELDVW